MDFSLCKDAMESMFFPPTEVHSFYQDVFITDMKKEIEEVKGESEGYKREANEFWGYISKLKNENG